MIGGDRGTLYRATVDKDGNLDLGNRIECKDANDSSASIDSITPLPDGSIMIGGLGALYRSTLSYPTLATLKQKIDTVISKGASNVI